MAVLEVGTYHRQPCCVGPGQDMNPRSHRTPGHTSCLLGREGGTEGGRAGQREGGREWGREGGRGEGGMEEGIEGGRPGVMHSLYFCGH